MNMFSGLTGNRHRFSPVFLRLAKLRNVDPGRLVYRTYYVNDVDIPEDVLRALVDLGFDWIRSLDGPKLTVLSTGPVTDAEWDAVNKLVTGSGILRTITVNLVT